MQLPRPMIGANRTKAGSLGALIVSYLSSAEFLARPQATQSTYRNILDRFRRQHGDKPIALLTREHIKAMLAAKVKTPAAANHWLRLLKVLMQLAVEEGYRPDNPASGVKRIKNRSDGFHTWTEAEIAQFEACHPIGSKARLAFALLLYTAQRRSDVVGMGRQHVRDNMVEVRQQKTGARLAIPLHPDLATIIEATPSGHLTYLVTTYEQPFTADRFGAWFRMRCDEAGLLKHCVAHGLRKAACRRLAEAGCSANVIHQFRDIRPCVRSNATLRPPTRRAWPGTACRRSYREQKLATAKNALPNRGNSFEKSNAEISTSNT